MDDGLFLGVMGLSRNVRDGVLGPVDGMEVGGVFADDFFEFGFHDFFLFEIFALVVGPSDEIY
jgi:hypothetical protein